MDRAIIVLFAETLRKKKQTRGYDLHETPCSAFASVWVISQIFNQELEDVPIPSPKGKNCYDLSLVCLSLKHNSVRDSGTMHPLRRIQEGI